MRTSKIPTLGLCCISLLSACNNNSNKRAECHGTYHAGVVDGLDRGADIIALVNNDGTIYSITEDAESQYEIASASGTIVWA